MSIRFLALLCVFCLPGAQAATLMEIRDAQGLTRVYTAGGKSRIEAPDEQGYMVIDSNRRSMIAVMPKERKVLDMSEALDMDAAAPPANAPRASFAKKGSGPTVAGYPTTEYGYSMAGKACGTLYTSTQVLKDTDLDQVLETMSRMAEQAGAMAATINTSRDPCQHADSQLVRHVQTIGAPLKVLDNQGRVISEVQRIDKNAALPPDAFAIPAGYEVQNTGRMMKQMPKIQNMMQQMQESGQLPPEALQQMQEMMQQYQQR
jgi:hypothetical protein